MPSKRFIYSLALGTTFFTYEYDDLVLKFSHTGSSLTLKYGITYLLLPPKWDLSLSGYLTLFNLSKNQDLSYRFFGINGRASYLIHEFAPDWKVHLAFGLYYLQTTRSDGQRGFTGVAGPQIYPVLRKTFKTKHSAYLYGKISPVSKDYFAFNSGSRELAFGAGYSVPVHRGRLITFSYDYANLALDIADSANAHIYYQTQSHSLSAGYTF